MMGRSTIPSGTQGADISVLTPAITITTIAPLRVSSAHTYRRSMKMDYLKVPEESPRRICRRPRPLSASDVDRLLKQPLYPDIRGSLSESSLTLSAGNKCKCTCRTSDDLGVERGSELTGQQMLAFFRLWSSDANSKKLLPRRQMDLPSSMKRRSVHRDCGCLTRNFLSYSNNSHKLHQLHCQCNSM